MFNTHVIDKLWNSSARHGKLLIHLISSKEENYVLPKSKNNSTNGQNKKATALNTHAGTHLKNIINKVTNSITKIRDTTLIICN